MISVALCTFNGSKYLCKQIDSILNQTMSVNEIIICDDSSTDLTHEILRQYKIKYPKLFKIHKNKTSLKTIKNFEKAISLCSGDYIFLSDQDDVWSSNKVQVMINYFRVNKNCSLLFTNGELVDSKGKNLNTTLWHKWNFTTYMQNKWLDKHNQMIDLIQNNNKVTGATVCFKKELMKDILPMSLPKGIWHDAFIALHAANKNGLCFLNTNLIKYRIHDEQQIGVKKEGNLENFEGISFYEYRNTLKEKFPDYIKYFDLKFKKTKQSLVQKILKKLVK